MIYNVIADISNSEVDRVFDYLGADGIPVGSRVYVPFGPRIIEGYVISTAEESDCDPRKLKDIVGVIDDRPVILPEMLVLSEFMRKKYHLRMIDCLRLFVPSEMRNGRVRPLVRKYVSLAENADEKIASIRSSAVKQLAAAEYLRGVPSESLEKLNKDFGNGAVRALIDKRIAVVSQERRNRTPLSEVGATEEEKPKLVPSQQSAFERITQGESGTYLLHGVTGSGKTEVYMSVIEEVVGRGKTAVMLVPEISLTPLMMKRFRSRFGDKVAVLHSGLSAGERFDEWSRIIRGEAVIAVGARSAIFAPMKNIGVIIIDEEHDGSYQSESNPRYSTFDIAGFRRKYNDAKLILGSATPSLESYKKALDKEFTLIRMPERINKKPLPEVFIVDMKDERATGNKSFISGLLREELISAVKEGNQAILFLNRRGYSSFVMCTQCGYVAKCIDCDVSLYYHRDENVLKCHYCGKKYRMLDVCPECKSEHIRRGRTGTEQVADYLAKEIPGAKVLRMDYDTTQSKEAHNDILRKFGNREANILVGTQMVTKGHDFPFVTLVGVLEGDQSLYLSDYRSSERTFQLITQVAGRAGRKDLPGKVVLQTYTPGHFALKYAARQDYEGFYHREINIREATKFPPFSVIVRFLITGENEEACIATVNGQFENVRLLAEENPEGFIFLQKMRSPLKRMEGKYRFQILMRLEPEYADGLMPRLFEISDMHERNVSVFAETDPQSMI